MSRRDDRIPLRQMLDHVQEAADMAAGRTREALETDRLFYLALLKCVEIVGEAASRVAEATRAANSEIPWRHIIGTRNRLVHGYDAVDRNILWDIATVDFPVLAGQLKKVLAG